MSIAFSGVLMSARGYACAQCDRAGRHQANLRFLCWHKISSWQPTWFITIKIQADQTIARSGKTGQSGLSGRRVSKKT